MEHNVIELLSDLGHLNNDNEMINVDKSIKRYIISDDVQKLFEKNGLLCLLTDRKLNEEHLKISMSLATLLEVKLQQIPSTNSTCFDVFQALKKDLPSINPVELPIKVVDPPKRYVDETLNEYIARVTLAFRFRFRCTMENRDSIATIVFGDIVFRGHQHDYRKIWNTYALGTWNEFYPTFKSPGDIGLWAEMSPKELQSRIKHVNRPSAKFSLK